MMNKYALIQGGVVVEIVETDGKISEMYHPDIQLIAVKTAPAIGSIFDGKTFVEPKNEPTQEQINSEAKAYLASTDWYLIRKLETGVKIPDDVLLARSEVRAKVVE